LRCRLRTGQSFFANTPHATQPSDERRTAQRRSAAWSSPAKRTR